MSFEVRSYQDAMPAEVAEQLAALFIRNMPTEPTSDWVDHEASYTDATVIQGRLEAGHSIYVAVHTDNEDASTVVGFIDAYTTESKNGTYEDMAWFMVDRDYRSKGTHGKQEKVAHLLHGYFFADGQRRALARFDPSVARIIIDDR